MDNDLKKVKITDYDIEAMGFGRIDNDPVIIDKALRGEVVLANVFKKGKKMSFASLVEIIEQSENRIEPLCKYYLECGGCRLMHMKYDEELYFKKEKVRKTLLVVANLSPKINDVVKSEDIHNYRNKVITHVDKDYSIYRGFYKEKTHDMIKIDKCLIENPYFKEVIDYLLNRLNEVSYDVYTINKKGIRSIMLRANNLNQIMLVVVNTNFDLLLKEILIEVYDKFDTVVSTYININNKETNVVLGSINRLVKGEKEIITNILDLKFLVSPNSFLQINYKQTTTMYQKVLELASPTKDDVLIDAYCGIGTITLFLAKYCKKIIGIESVKEAIDNANNNKALNNIDNAYFILGKCEEELLKIEKQEKIDIMIFDPPRKGCDISFLQTVINMKVKKLVYVSCNVKSFSKDVLFLTNNNYELIEVTPFDLFSRTPHVECVSVLKLKE